jgi:Phytanoyl-CoA dioxygenase (PhyH)
MFRFLRSRHGSRAGAAVAEPPRGEEFDGTTEELLAEIQRLGEANRGDQDPATERRLLTLRHLAGIRLLDGAPPDPAHPAPAFDRLPEADGLPDIARADLTPELLRAGILRDGCLLVRGLVPRDAALAFADGIERAFEERDQDAPAAGWYEEFTPQPRFGSVDERPWIKEGGGVLAIDSPTLSFEMLELFESAGVPRLVAAYLGEPALISVQKTTLRKAEPTVGGAWHQDGAFMGKVRSLNLWLALSRCGDVAPGLDLVPRRLDGLAPTGTDEAMISYQVSQSKAEAAAGDVPIIRPVFEPGDALFFDELFLHQTGSDPSMPNPRFAIENWFFGGSAFPPEFAPVAV